MLSRRLIAAVIAAIFLCSVAIVTVNADNTPPLLISFSRRLSDKVIQGQKYEMSITWTNTNQKKSYDAYLLLLATSNRRVTGSSDVTLTYDGIIIIPKCTGKSLQFQLPKQTFDLCASGILSVEVQHNTLGTYDWTIGIVKT
jgi:hypothetical protein